MQTDDFGVMVERVFEKCREVMARKGVDYTAGDDDRAKNFKESAKRSGITPFQVWSIFAGKHIDAVMSYASRGRIESEELAMRVVDVINYLLLLLALVHDLDKGEWERSNEALKEEEEVLCDR